MVIVANRALKDLFQLEVEVLDFIALLLQQILGVRLKHLLVEPRQLLREIDLLNPLQKNPGLVVDQLGFF